MAPHARASRVCLRLGLAQTPGVLTSDVRSRHVLARCELSFLHSPAASQSRRIQSSDGFPGITAVRTARHFEAHGAQPGLDDCGIRALTALHPPKYRKNHDSRGI